MSHNFHHSRPHPWHGLEAGKNPPVFVNAYIEITPFDLVEYEVDKATGYTMVDRPQRTSSQPPTLYGFVPRTYCGERVRDLTPGATEGDGDPLDICVISERPINRSDVILHVKVIGGLQCLDGGEADDKIIAVLESDTVWSHSESLNDIPPVFVERLKHYFSTYKMKPDLSSEIHIAKIYGPVHAAKVVEAALADYEEGWGQYQKDDAK